MDAVPWSVAYPVHYDPQRPNVRVLSDSYASSPWPRSELMIQLRKGYSMMHLGESIKTPARFGSPSLPLATVE